MQHQSGGMNESEVLDKLRRHVRILVDIARLVGENADLNRFLDQAVVQIARAVEITHVKVLQYRPRTSDLLVVAGIGWKEGVVRTATLSADLRSPPGRAFQTAEPVNIKNLNEQDEYVHSNFLKEHGIISLTNVPVRIDGAAWGVLEVDSTTPRDFSEDTTDFLTAAAALIGTFVLRHLEFPDKETRLLTAAAEAQKRDILLREMQHRVKNNFQLVLASISLQKRRHQSQELHRALDHVANRINAISLAHDQLAPRDERQIVKLSDYIRALCSAIHQQIEEVEVDVITDELELSIDRAVPVGLILNEAAMNSIKHAFGPEGGRIRVRLEGGIGYGEAILSVSDNGRGIQNATERGSGLNLIASLARQIGGTVEQESSASGTTTSLRFPLIA
ncbi:sensor histidine kinase [Bradyrhizobium paxllaeri]|uniref:sensor histidine kinase n=1 Tax=Bradyrhizobium paxllaeri TaxID=190148 RepID=UPI000810CC6D|nr:histidine kinase dimerization/phosphoacceptor domain -containing protein [Bradyrhizobium paxllaeri]